jgi:anthranilate phosphoribosyltransferase
LSSAAPNWFSSVMTDLLAGRDLAGQIMRGLMADLLAGTCGEIETVALLIALRAKGESVGELAEAARVLREHMIVLETSAAGVLDTCGTGGDETGTFNISTATAIVVAAAGIPVVKHGGRAVTSPSGSSEVLEALGVSIQKDAGAVRNCLDRAGIAFCFAPLFHPALAHLAPLRRRLRVRTIFNCLGPLANPARAAYQLLGVGHKKLLDPMAGALGRLGIRHAFLVCGSDGLDEVTLGGISHVREVRGNQVTSLEWQPGDFGLEPCEISELAAANPAASAEIIRETLEGRDGPATRIVLANAAAALLAAEQVGSLREGVERARSTLRDGRARQVLERLVTASAAAPQD